MPDEKEKWLEVCAQAATEQDPVKLNKLIRELNELLGARLSSRRREARQTTLTDHSGKP